MSFCKKKKNKNNKNAQTKKSFFPSLYQLNAFSIFQFLNAKLYHISFSIITIFVNLSTYTHFRNLDVLLYPKNRDLCHSISYIH